MAWGYGANGRLGLGDEADRCLPEMVHLPERATSVCCGGYHSGAITGMTLLDLIFQRSSSDFILVRYWQVVYVGLELLRPVWNLADQRKRSGTKFSDPLSTHLQCSGSLLRGAAHSVCMRTEITRPNAYFGIQIHLFRSTF